MKRVDVNLSDATEELYGKVEKTFRDEKVSCKIACIPL